MTDQSPRSDRPRLAILYRDERCVIIDKPAGLLVHPSRIAKRAPDTAMERLRDQLGRLVYVIHRLDRATSGALLFALDAAAASLLADAFRAGAARKTYLALVRGWAPERGCIDRPLLKKRDKKTDRKARRDAAPQEAITEFECLARAELPIPVGRYATGRYSLLRLSPKTGRRHQIRRHLKHLSHPIIGDSEHGDRDHNRLFRERFGVERLMLHARALSLSSALGPVAARAALGPDFLDGLRAAFGAEAPSILEELAGST